jgi:hypothetical protein
MNNVLPFPSFFFVIRPPTDREGLQRCEILGGHQNTFLAPVRHGLEFHAGRTSRCMG